MKLRLNTVLKYLKKNYLNLAHILSPQYIYIYVYTHKHLSHAIYTLYTAKEDKSSSPRQF